MPPLHRTAIDQLQVGITEHLEGDATGSSKAIYDTAAELVTLADALGVRYAWFAEHHIHVHRGHLPAPLLFAIHLAAKTKRIATGTAVICLNHHRAIDVAEQVAIADVLSDGRIAIGFGSGSTPAEASLFDVPDWSETERHRHFDAALETIERWWSDVQDDRLPRHRLPRPRPGLMQRCWAAVNSVGAARIAGTRHLNVLFSHLRTPAQYAEYAAAYREAGGTGLIAANRPILIASTLDEARQIGGAPIQRLWRRFRAEGKIPADAAEADSVESLCAHPLNFIVGDVDSVVRQLVALWKQIPFNVLNAEVTWDGLPAEASRETLRQLMQEVLPRLRAEKQSL